MVVWLFYLRPRNEGAAKIYVSAFEQKYTEICKANARVVHPLTLEHERVAEVHVPPVEMAFVAIRLPQHLEVSSTMTNVSAMAKGEHIIAYRRARVLAPHPPTPRDPRK